MIESWTIKMEPYYAMSALQSVGVPAGVCQTAEDRCDNDPQLAHLGWLTELTGTKIGTWPLAEIPIKMSETPPHCGGWRDRAAPVYGEHNRDILTGLLGLSESDIDSLAEKGII
jgi:crotonobetainyl-CoA:carnitine CoA-transferase CaiB-like acyl-CoA transferase